MKSIKSSIDCKPPRSTQMAHLHVNRKAIQERRQREQLIRRDNARLHAKMASIGATAKDVTTNKSLRFQRSLNIDRRRHDLARVTRENKAFLRRLNGVQPSCTRRQWAQEFQSSQTHSVRLSDFRQFSPPRTGSPSPGGRRRPRTGRRRRPHTALPQVSSAIKLELPAAFAIPSASVEEARAPAEAQPIPAAKQTAPVVKLAAEASANRRARPNTANI